MTASLKKEAVRWTNGGTLNNDTGQGREPCNGQTYSSKEVAIGR